MARRRGLAALAAGALLVVSTGAPWAQVPFQSDRSYSQCANDAYRRVGPPPRSDARPGDDLAMLQRRRQDYEDRYYRALDQCLRDAERRRVRRD